MPEPGDTENALVRGAVKPDVWSPAGSFWGRLANLQADKRYTADENPSIVRTPLVIAMFKQLADAYGYPKRELGYKPVLSREQGLAELRGEAA